MITSELNYEYTGQGTTGTIAELNVKLGDVVKWIGFEHIGNLRADYLHDGVMIFRAADGTPYGFGRSDNFRIISRASQSPVRTVSRKEIVPGVYGRVWVDGNVSCGTNVGFASYSVTRDDLTAEIETLTAIRDALA